MTPNLLTPQSRAILLAMAAMEEVRRETLTSDQVAWRLGRMSWWGAAAQPEAKLPSWSASSWFYRHRKALAAAKLAWFQPNGYIWTTPEGKAEAARLRALPKPEAEARRHCADCGAPLLDARPAEDRRVYACGAATQHVGLSWFAFSPCGDKDSGLLASKEPTRDGMPVRIADCMTLADPETPAPLRPALGTLLRRDGRLAWIDVGAAEPRLVPVVWLVEAGKPDLTALTDHQNYALDRLRNGTAMIVRTRDGALTIRATENAREGNVVCQPATFRRLALSGALDAFLVPEEAAA